MNTFTVDTLSDDPNDGPHPARGAGRGGRTPPGPTRSSSRPASRAARSRSPAASSCAASDVTIDGGTGVTIDANELSRVLAQGNYSQVVLANLTVTGGKSTGR